MSRHPHLAAIEGVHGAIRAANKRSPANLTFKSFRILVALYNASERGHRYNMNGLIKRLYCMGNVDTEGAAYQLIRLMRLKGYIEQEGIGRGAVIRPSLAGKNYVKAVERYLRNIRWSDY